jgi:hypothetical protein
MFQLPRSAALPVLIRTPNLDYFPMVEHPGVSKFIELPLLTERNGV